MAAADATTTLRIGSFMFANDFRHPVFLAQETATIDLLSNGRFELGLDTGWLRRERFGISYIVLRENASEASAPVVERLTGT